MEHTFNHGTSSGQSIYSSVYRDDGVEGRCSAAFGRFSDTVTLGWKLGEALAQVKGRIHHVSSDNETGIGIGCLRLRETAPRQRIMAVHRPLAWCNQHDYGRRVWPWPSACLCCFYR